jgi:hypothetical protein
MVRAERQIILVPKIFQPLSTLFFCVVPFLFTPNDVLKTSEFSNGTQPRHIFKWISRIYFIIDRKNIVMRSHITAVVQRPLRLDLEHFVGSLSVSRSE